jgi:tRNA(fMet)-specific endonuclease VapC
LGILVDASVLIAYERGHRSPGGWAARHRGEATFLSVVTVSELLHGVHRARASEIRSRREAFIQELIEEVPLIPIGLQVARTHARIWSDLASRGAIIGAHDLWLAATCLTHDLSILTANVREFQRVSGLTVEVWTEADA